MATTKDKLQQLLNSDKLSAEDKIRKAAYLNFTLPIALGASELGAYRSFDALTTEPVVANNNKPLCTYYEIDQSPRTDYSITCSIPAELSPLNKRTVVSLEQDSKQPVYYKTSNGETYQAYSFLQTIDAEEPSSNEATLSSIVLIHPGIGITSIDLQVVDGVNKDGIKTTQTKWEWFNDNPNILDQDNY